MTTRRRSLLLVAGIVVAVGAVIAALEFGSAPENGRAGLPAVPVAQSAEPLAIDFEAVDLDGESFRGIDLKGKFVLLDFWAVWCPPCLDAFPKLTELARDLEDEPFELVGIALYSGDHDSVGEFLEAYEVGYKNVVGEEDLAFRYGVIGYPTHEF